MLGFTAQGTIPGPCLLSYCVMGSGLCSEGKLEVALCEVSVIRGACDLICGGGRMWGWTLCCKNMLEDEEELSDNILWAL